jgi:hypothetical protein
MQMAYYDFLPEIEVATDNATATFFSSVLIPVHWKGFTAIAAAIAIHLVSVVLITAWFLPRVKLTTLGNTWLTVAQLVHGETAGSTISSDKEVEKKLKPMIGSQQRETAVGVGRFTQDDKVGIKTCSDNDINFH